MINVVTAIYNVDSTFITPSYKSWRPGENEAQEEEEKAGPHHVPVCCRGLSSPRAESARAFTGRRNSHSGGGEDLTASASMQQGHRKSDL